MRLAYIDCKLQSFNERPLNDVETRKNLNIAPQKSTWFLIISIKNKIYYLRIQYLWTLKI